MYLCEEKTDDLLKSKNTMYLHCRWETCTCVLCGMFKYNCVCVFTCRAHDQSGSLLLCVHITDGHLWMWSFADTEDTSQYC